MGKLELSEVFNLTEKEEIEFREMLAEDEVKLMVETKKWVDKKEVSKMKRLWLAVMVIGVLIIRGVVFAQTIEQYRTFGVLKQSSGNYLGAISDYDMGLALPYEGTYATVDMQLRKADCLSSLSRKEEAVLEYVKVFKWGNMNYGKEAFLKMKQLEPNYVTVLNTMGTITNVIEWKHAEYYFRGKVKESLKDYQGAYDDLDEAWRLRPDDQKVKEQIIQEIKEVELRLK